jgi:hypothetical protein
MALTPTNVIAGQARSYPLGGGLKVVETDVTLGTASDYSSGFDFDGIKSKLGLSYILDVPSSSLRTTGGTLYKFWSLWDGNAKKVRFFTSVAGTTATEIVEANLVASGGDIVRATVVGVG